MTQLKLYVTINVVSVQEYVGSDVVCRSVGLYISGVTAFSFHTDAFGL